MEHIISQLPTTPIGWVGLIILSVVGILWGVSKVRANDMKILRDTNSDQGQRITMLEAAVLRLEQQVTDLQHQNKTLNDLVIVALKQYFFENPTLAKDMKATILK